MKDTDLVEDLLKERGSEKERDVKGKEGSENANVNEREKERGNVKELEKKEKEKLSEKGEGEKLIDVKESGNEKENVNVKDEGSFINSFFTFYSLNLYNLWFVLNI